MEWVFIAILATVFFSIGNMFDKHLLDKYMKGAGGFIMLAIGVSSLTLIGIISFFGIELLTFFQTSLILLAGILLVLAYLLYAKALELEDASLIIPLFQMVPIFLLISGFLFLGENLTLTQIIAFVIIFIGSLILGVEEFSMKIFKIKKAFWYMFFASILLAISPTIFKFFVLELGFLTTITYDIMGQVVGALGLFLVPAYRKELFDTIKSINSRAYVYLGLTDFFDLLGQFFLKYALTLGPVALVSLIISGVQPFMILILALLLTFFFPKIIKENISKKTILQKVIGIVIITVGIMVLFLL